MRSQCRATFAEGYDRQCYAAELIDSGLPLAVVSAAVADRYGLSTRQGRRYASLANRSRRVQSPLPAEPVLGWCYVVRHLATGVVKIGATRQWSDRANALKVGQTCALVQLWEGPDFRQREDALHQRFAEFRLPGSEWFHCPTDSVFD
jgi:hypothetical protein